MRLSFKPLLDSIEGFTVRHERAIFTTFARILAVICILVAVLYAWKLGVQLKMN